VLKVQLALQDLRAHQVFKVGQASLDRKVYKVVKVYKDQQASQAHRARKVYLVHKVLLE